MEPASEKSQHSFVQNTVQFQANTMSSVQMTFPGGVTRSSDGGSVAFNVESTRDFPHQNKADEIFKEIVKPRVEEQVVLSAADLNSKVKIHIVETETFWVLDIVPTKMATDADGADGVKSQNNKYMELVKSRAGNDRYTNRGTNTFCNPSICKGIQTDRVEKQDQGENATAWDMYDEFQELERQLAAKAAEESEKVDDGVVKTAAELASAEEQKEWEEDAEMTRKESITEEDMNKAVVNLNQSRLSEYSVGDSEIFGNQTSLSSYMSVTTDSSHTKDIIMNSENMYDNLFLLERALNLNSYKHHLAVYRGIQLMDVVNDSSNEDSSSSSIGSDAIPSFGSQPQLNLLWRFPAPSTQATTSHYNIARTVSVTGICVNPQNTDILAVSYGQLNFGNPLSGMVCCWSLKNINYPERCYHMPCSVTAVAWSKGHPNLLAVGMYNGIIYVMDVRKRVETPVIDTVESPHHHLGPVRGLEWISRDSGRSEADPEVLISISTDGRVTQWAIKKGFESTGDCDFHYDLMKLKKISTRVPGLIKQRKSDALISRYAYGTTISFNPDDNNIYLVGTEDGFIHKCSCSYNEQYLENFFGHTSSIYALRWSPFVPDVFLSCSADWTLKMWKTERAQPIVNIRTGTKAINSICWSPFSSVVFACVGEGWIEVWNLQVSTLDPVLLETNHIEFTNIVYVCFSENSSSLFVGDSKGTVQVYKLINMPLPPNTKEEQVEALNKVVQSCIASQLTK